MFEFAHRRGQVFGDLIVVRSGGEGGELIAGAFNAFKSLHLQNGYQDGDIANAIFRAARIIATNTPLGNAGGHDRHPGV